MTNAEQITVYITELYVGQLNYSFELNQGPPSLDLHTFQNRILGYISIKRARAFLEANFHSMGRCAVRCNLKLQKEQHVTHCTTGVAKGARRGHALPQLIGGEKKRVGDRSMKKKSPYIPWNGGYTLSHSVAFLPRFAPPPLEKPCLHHCIAPSLQGSQCHSVQHEIKQPDSCQNFKWAKYQRIVYYKTIVKTASPI